MGCINVKVSSNNTIGLTTNANKPIVVNTIPITCGCGVDCTCNESFNINVFTTPTSQVIVKPKVGGLNISCGIVCSVGNTIFVDVFPQEVQWITTDDVVIYSVKSNTDWLIE